jgi:hypothetical protein
MHKRGYYGNSKETNQALADTIFCKEGAMAELIEHRPKVPKVGGLNLCTYKNLFRRELKFDLWLWYFIICFI